MSEHMTDCKTILDADKYVETCEQKNASTSVSSSIIQRSQIISKLLQQYSDEWSFEAKDTLRTKLDDVPHLLTECKAQFENCEDIKGLLDAICGIMNFSEDMTTVYLLMLAFKITAILCANSLVCTGMSEKLLHSLVISLENQLLTSRQREYGYYALMVILNNPHMLQYFITKTCDPVYFNGYQSLYKKATFQALNLEQQSGHGKELLLWNQISQKITVYNACQHIKKCADEIIHLMKSQNTESTHDNGTLKNFVSSHLFETLRNIECLQEQLLCVLALEHLDELYDGEQYFSQTTHVGLTIPYQQLSIVSFDLFSHFQVLDYLTVWMMVARCCQPHSAGSQLLAKCLTFISAQMLSRRGITYLTNIFLSKVSTTVVQCYHLCWPDELTIPENDLDNADATVTLMIIWEKLLENLPQNLSNDQILSEDHELQEKIYRSNSIHESYNSFWIGSDRTIQSLCKNIVHVTPTNFEIMDSIFACKSIGQASSNILLQLKSRMNAFLFSKEIYTAMNKQNTRSSNTYHAEDEIESKALKCLAAMSQSTSEQQEVARSVLELHLFPAILKGTLSTHNDTKQSAILVAEAIVESKHSLPWLMHEMNYAGVKDILALFPNLWRWVEVIDTYHNSGLTEAIECCSRNVISTVNSDVLLTDPTILRNLIACLQLCLWKTTLARFQGIAGHITGGQIPEIISSQCEGGDIAQLSLSQMATLMVITTKHLRTWMTRHSTTRPQIENRKMTFMNSARGSILEYGTRISRFSNRSDSRSSLQLLISLCDTLHLLSQLMRQACEALFKYSINPWNRTGPTDNCDSLAKLIANTAVDVLCIIDDLRTVLREASHDHHVTNIMSSIKRTKLEIITVFHLECSIVVKHNKTNGKDSSNAEVRYSSIGLSRYFGRYILDCSLKTILENPSSANTCLKIVEEVLPDNFQEEFENLDAVSQQLRIYWRDLVAGMIPNMLKLRFLVISNNQELSRSASIVLSKIIGVCCDSEEFIGKLKFELSKELNSHIAYAMYARKCEGTSRHIGLQMYQNEILIRRWLQFTGHIRCLRNIHIYFSSALEQAKLTIDEMKGFSEVQAFEAVFVAGAICEQPAIGKVASEGSMHSIEISNLKNGMNIGGGKAYNRNEFRDVHGCQSANTSRPPSVHVDDYANA